MDALRKAALLTLEGLDVPNTKQYTNIAGYDIQIRTEWAFTNLVWMKQTCIDNIETFPIDKINRWIGFIQGALAAQGMLNVSQERDRTRPFFHAAYKELEINIPDTLTKP
jgi:hypothetical protein